MKPPMRVNAAPSSTTRARACRVRVSMLRFGSILVKTFQVSPNNLSELGPRSAGSTVRGLQDAVINASPEPLREDATLWSSLPASHDPNNRSCPTRGTDSPFISGGCRGTRIGAVER